MDANIGIALLGAGAALAGAWVGSRTSIAVEKRRAEGAAAEAHRATLRAACSDFTAAIARVRSHSYGLTGVPTDDEPLLRALAAALDEARAGCERLRILVSDSDTQRAARLALRHAYAVWKVAETGLDPRAAQYPGEDPHARLRTELTRLYVGVRRELGVAQPDDVFHDLDD